MNVKCLYIYIFIFAQLYNVHPQSIYFQVWGPGLKPHQITMPARYFFIQAFDQNNNSITHSLETEPQVIIDGGTKKKTSCRIWTKLLDRKDGSYIVRYKVYEPCSYVKITLTYENEQIGNSPYIINDYVYPDNCYCPQYSLQDVINIWNCGNVPLQIDNDFLNFKKINWDETRLKVIDQFNKPYSVSLCHYIIKNNQVYRKCYGQHVGFNMFSDSILLSLTRKTILPDLEFFINLGDWPLSSKNMPNKYPIFSWCGSKDANDIVMPTYELTESTLENMGKVTLDMLSVQGNFKYVWEDRKEILFWRGRDSNKNRLNLIKISKTYPELFNVSLTNFFFFKDEEDTYGPRSEHISFFKFFDYKYQLSIDGTVAAYRMPFLLGGGSLVFKPYSKYYEHFYSKLEPNVHYVPVETDLSDLVEKIQWAKDNDSKAKEIAQSGKKFANTNLLPKNILCYYMHLLNKLSKVTTSKVKVLEGMELINQKSDYPCDCLNKEKNIKEEL